MELPLADEHNQMFMDATIVRAHQHTAGAPKKTVAIKRLADREAG
jgi:hypothetical protein